VALIRYRISVRGRLTERLGSAFGGMTLGPAPGQTVLVGEIRDQSHLYGVLDRVRSLGLELISVRLLCYLTARTSTSWMSGALASRSADTLASAAGIWPLRCAVRASSVAKVSKMP
jgi:hypothetical protein